MYVDVCVGLAGHWGQPVVSEWQKTMAETVMSVFGGKCCMCVKERKENGKWVEDTRFQGW